MLLSKKKISIRSFFKDDVNSRNKNVVFKNFFRNFSLLRRFQREILCMRIGPRPWPGPLRHGPYRQHRLDETGFQAPLHRHSVQNANVAVPHPGAPVPRVCRGPVARAFRARVVGVRGTGAVRYLQTVNKIIICPIISQSWYQYVQSTTLEFML